MKNLLKNETVKKFIFYALLIVFAAFVFKFVFHFQIFTPLTAEEKLSEIREKMLFKKFDYFASPAFQSLPPEEQDKHIRSFVENQFYD